MTATEMKEAFQRLTNESYSSTLFTWEISAWLNKAQTSIYNNAIDDIVKRITTLASPNKEFHQRVLQPFIVTDKDIETQSDGSYIFPPLLQHLGNMSAITNKDSDVCDKQVKVVDIKEMHQNELNQILSSPLSKPVWEDNKVPIWLWYRPMRISDMKDGQRIEQIYPKRTYNINVTWYKAPKYIRIKNTNEEVAYQSIANYVSMPTDSNCEFIPTLHDRVVTEAVSMYLKSLPDAKAQLLDNELNIKI